MAERSDVHAYFWVEGFDGPPAQITSQMGLEPCETRGAGDVSISGRVTKCSQWAVASPLARGNHLIQEYLEALLPLLETRAEVVARLARTCSVGINCVGYYYGSNPGLHLSAPLVVRLAALGLSVDFDLYNHARENEP